MHPCVGCRIGVRLDSVGYIHGEYGENFAVCDLHFCSSGA